MELLKKCTSTECILDIFNRLLLILDPYLSSIRPKVSKKSKDLQGSKEALDLMLPDEDVTDQHAADSEEKIGIDDDLYSYIKYCCMCIVIL